MTNTLINYKPHILVVVVEISSSMLATESLQWT